jgi:DNA-directed RNA polymerase specialized sigma54-like protein
MSTKDKVKDNVKKTIDKERKKLVPISDKDIAFLKTTISKDV